MAALMHILEKGKDLSPAASTAKLKINKYLASYPTKHLHAAEYKIK